MKIRVKENQLEEIEGLTTEYPYTMHHADLKDTVIPWHWHEELEFDYILNGSVQVKTINKSYVFKKNEAFFINTDILCTMSGEGSQQSTMDSHLFHPIFLGGHFKSVFETKYLEPVLQNKKLEILEIRGENTRQQEILKRLKMLSYLQKKENSEFQTRNILSEIWLLLLEEIQKLRSSEVSTNLESQDRIQTMMSFIHNNYQEKISLEDIADSASVSKRECLRCFQNCIHKTPFQYLLDYRMEIAKRQLKTTEIPILDIALQSGFSNGAYFGKVFREICGETPGAYRKRYREPIGRL